MTDSGMLAQPEALLAVSSYAFATPTRSETH